MTAVIDRKPNLGAAIRAALLTADPHAKVMATRKLVRNWRLERFVSELDDTFDAAMPDHPARPDQPELLSPTQMPRRGKGGSLRGRIALWHALAHIEFVAIDLALDIVGRFGAQMDRSFTDDFFAVAADEAMHFALLDRKLRSLGSYYGALPAHGGLWEAASDTAHEVDARLAIVPMVLEARGLDVTPAMRDRVLQAGDEHGARILSRILNDEIRHVGAGTKHFNIWCENAGIEPREHWQMLVRKHFRGAIKPPFNNSARLAAGLSRDFYNCIAS